MLTLPIMDFFPMSSRVTNNVIHLKEVLIENILSAEEASNIYKTGMLEMQVEDLEIRFIREINKRK